jgi:hypothetical protein
MSIENLSAVMGSREIAFQHEPNFRLGFPIVDGCSEIYRRIVACVNACAGLSTEVLEQPGIIHHRIESACGELYEVKQQRDALLAALKMAVQQNINDMVMTGEECRQCMVAIAAAT